MLNLNDLSFKNYFVLKDGIKSYITLTVVKQDLERAFRNLIVQESENTIMTVDESRKTIVIKNFDSATELSKFYDENYDLIAGHSFIKASKLTLSILWLVNIKKLSEKDLEKTIENVRK